MLTAIIFLYSCVSALPLIKRVHLLLRANLLQVLLLLLLLLSMNVWNVIKRILLLPITCNFLFELKCLNCCLISVLCCWCHIATAQIWLRCHILIDIIHLHVTIFFVNLIEIQSLSTDEASIGIIKLRDVTGMRRTYLWLWWLWWGSLNELFLIITARLRSLLKARKTISLKCSLLLLLYFMFGASMAFRTVMLMAMILVLIVTIIIRCKNIFVIINLAKIIELRIDW
jgi:hypothetical protein